jgi:bacterioferritin (cytochrome b1)
MSLESFLTKSAGIPLGVASTWLLQLKQASIVEPPDMTGTLEGAYAAPLPELLNQLSQVIAGKMRSVYAYTLYSTCMRGVMQGAVHEAFEERSIEEREAVEYHTRRLGIMGGAPHVPDIEAPPPSTEPEDIVKILIRLEQENIARLRQLRDMLGENVMKYKVEGDLAEDQRHLDALWELLPEVMGPAQLLGAAAPGATPAAPPGAPPPAEEVAEPEAEAAPEAPPAEAEGPKMAAIHRMKLAFDQVMGDSGQGQAGTDIATPSNDAEGDGEVQRWMQGEMAGRAMEEGNIVEFYKKRMQATQAQLQAAQGQQQMTQQQLDSLNQQAQQAQASIAQAQQAASQVEQAAMANLEKAHNTAVQAMQQTQAVQQQLLAQQQVGMAARTETANMKSQLMQIAQQGDIPPQPPANVSITPGGAAPMGPGAPGQPGAPPSAEPVPGEAGADAGAGAAQGEAPPAAGPSPDAQPAAQASTPGEKTGAETPPISMLKRLGIAGAGALVGGATGGLTGAGVGATANRLRGAMASAEASNDGSFLKAVQLAGAKSALIPAELAESHPWIPAVGGALAGMSSGAMAAPHLSHAAENFQTIRNLRNAAR